MWYTRGLTREEEVVQLREEHAALRDQLAQALARIAELEQQSRKDPPSFVKPTRPKPADPKPPRKKRGPQHNRSQRRLPPSRIQQEVSDKAPPVPVEVVQHQVFKRFCPLCRRWHAPKLALAGQVFAQGRIGVRVAVLIAFVACVLRAPIGRIQTSMLCVHLLSVSTGECVELLHHVRRALQDHIDSLKQGARAAAVLHADETSWREGGHRGYSWALALPGHDAIPYYEYDPSRPQTKLKRMLDGRFEGQLGQLGQ